jgi:hypothetical protein
MPQAMNFTEYFKEEKDVWVQNVSRCQVSVMFDLAPGRSESYLFVPNTDPVNLSQSFPFQAIKASMDLRRMLIRVPAALRLMTDADAKGYYERQAKDSGLKDADTAMMQAEERRAAVHSRQPLPNAPDPIKLHEVVSDGQHLGEKKIVRSNLDPVTAEDEINPRVLNLCLQVHPQVPDQEKMSAQTMIAEIEGIPDLKLVDWEYFLAHGFYKSVRNMAKQRIAKMIEAEAEEEKSATTKKAGKKAGG